MKVEKEDKALKKAIQDLPALQPDDDLWNKIEGELEGTYQHAQSRSTWRYWAAILAIPLTIGWTLWLTVFQSQNASGITYTQETLNAWPVEFAASEDKAFDVFLREECGPEKAICKKPEFKSLMAELEEVNEEVTIILTVIDESGNDENLLKARHRLEKEEVRLKKKIVKLLRG